MFMYASILTSETPGQLAIGESARSRDSVEADPESADSAPLLTAFRSRTSHGNQRLQQVSSAYE